MISELLESKNDIFSQENLEMFNYKNPLNTKNLANLFQSPMLNFNKNHIFPPFNMNPTPPAPLRMNHERIIENIEDIKYMNQKNLATPFKRAGTHVAIAYYIYVNKNKSKFSDNKNTNECDPTYHARVLRERKNVIFFNFFIQNMQN